MNEPEYDLETLIKSLEKIRDDGSGSINFAKALYTLSKEVMVIKKILEENDSRKIKAKENE